MLSILVECFLTKKRQFYICIISFRLLYLVLYQFNLKLYFLEVIHWSTELIIYMVVLCYFPAGFTLLLMLHEKYHTIYGSLPRSVREEIHASWQISIRGDSNA